jgi:plasmid stability protein
MVQLLVRNVPEEVARELRRRAEAHGRSVEAEHRLLLEEALRPARAAFAARAADWRKRLRGRWTDDSTDLIRADRDRQ